MVEDLLAERGIIVSHQTVRMWVEKFGRQYAKNIRRSSAGQFDSEWHLDEVVVTMRGVKHWLWRVVDQDGFVLDALVQSCRNTKQGAAPRVMIIDKLRSYGPRNGRSYPVLSIGHTRV